MHVPCRCGKAILCVHAMLVRHVNVLPCAAALTCAHAAPKQSGSGQCRRSCGPVPVQIVTDRQARRSHLQALLHYVFETLHMVLLNRERWGPSLRCGFPTSAPGPAHICAGTRLRSARGAQRCPLRWMATTRGTVARRNGESAETLAAFFAPALFRPFKVTSATQQHLPYLQVRAETNQTQTNTQTLGRQASRHLARPYAPKAGPRETRPAHGTYLLGLRIASVGSLLTPLGAARRTPAPGTTEEYGCRVCRCAGDDECIDQ